ncbi:MAG: DUF4438 domain-containing protein [Ardenticatenaceae bacterium]|nr:DUF4438 domain-containing protein [Ardenticatenaceae bacterium]
MLKMNQDRLVQISVLGWVTPAIYLPSPLGDVGSQYLVSSKGTIHAVPMSGGIVYNVKVGDRARGWAADHLSPGVSIKHDNPGANIALNAFACIGNVGTVMTGAARGAKGTVTGKYGHGGNVILHFEDATLDALAYGDKIQIKATGVGLEFPDFPGVQARSLSPQLAEKMGFEFGSGGKLCVPVRGIAPASLVGSGHGHTSDRWDLDLQTSDEDALAEAGLEDVRLGDIIAIRDYDTTYSNFYRRGAVTVGVVSQGDSVIGGHGAGVTPILSSSDGFIEPYPDEGANIALLLGLRDSL